MFAERVSCESESISTAVVDPGIFFPLAFNLRITLKTRPPLETHMLFILFIDQSIRNYKNKMETKLLWHFSKITTVMVSEIRSGKLNLNLTSGGQKPADVIYTQTVDCSHRL